MGEYQTLHQHSHKTPSPGSTNPGYFLPKTARTWLVCAFLSLALLHLLCCSPPGAQQAVFSPLLHYLNGTYPSLSSGRRSGGRRSCDYSEGRWVWAPGHARRYNGTACNIKESHDCIRNGRPDTGYLDWRWQPAGCRLPAFDAAAFLAAVRGKHVAFVGDSMARNQAESLVCLLSAAFPHRLVYRDADHNTRQFWRWYFPSHGVTVSVYWAPFLVMAKGKMEDYSKPYVLVYLDELASRWEGDADTMDVAVVTAGHWFWNGAVYHNGSEVIGTHLYPELNHTEISFISPYREAYRKSAERLSSGRPRTVVLTTYSSNHFEGKQQDDPTACANKAPYKGGGEKEVHSLEEFRRVVLDEAAAAAARSGAIGVRFEVQDVTKLAVMRPEGHPGPYMHRDPFANGMPERCNTPALS